MLDNEFPPLSSSRGLFLFAVGSGSRRNRREGYVGERREEGREDGGRMEGRGLKVN
jgi:hypothetical protein